jgi:hypothetical protein
MKEEWRSENTGSHVGEGFKKSGDPVHRKHGAED